MVKLLRKKLLLYTTCFFLLASQFTIMFAHDAFNAQYTSIAWSPNSKVLAVVESHKTILVFSALNAHIIYPYTPPSGNITSLAWSPDGKRIIFGLARNIKVQLYQLEIDQLMGDNSNLTAVLLTAFEADNPLWSPDGRFILYTSGTNGNIYIMNADTTHSRLLVTREGDASEPAWSPSGDKVIYVTKLTNTNNYSLFIVDVNTKTVQQIETPPIENKAPAWSADGTRVAAILLKGVALITLADGNVTIVAESQNARDVAWSPDGKLLLYSIAENNLTIYQADNVGQDAQHLTNTQDHRKEYGAVWSPDGNQIAFGVAVLADGTETQGIFIIQTNGEGMRRLY